ncbi:hypothetical protein Tco_1396005 [Tanacetum coccineum]
MTMTSGRRNKCYGGEEVEMATILVPQVPILQLHAFTAIVPLFSTFKASTSSLILSGSRIPTIPYLMADSLVVRALYNARAIVVKCALVAQWDSIVVTFPLPFVASILY